MLPTCRTELLTESDLTAFTQDGAADAVRGLVYGEAAAVQYNAASMIILMMRIDPLQVLQPYGEMLLELAEKIRRNTADWTQSTSLPNWHNVNIAQHVSVSLPFYYADGDSAMLKASYNVHRLIQRRTFGQVPGGMFGA